MVGVGFAPEALHDLARKAPVLRRPIGRKERGRRLGIEVFRKALGAQRLENAFERIDVEMAGKLLLEESWPNAKGDEEAIDRNEVLHLLDRDAGEINSARCAGSDDAQISRFQREGGVQILQHECLLDLCRLAQPAHELEVRAREISGDLAGSRLRSWQSG